MDGPDAVATRLRRALGIDAGTSAEPAAAAQVRAQEDAALAAWSAAITNHDRTVREHDELVRRLTDELNRAMRPLERGYYERIDACLTAEDWTALARFDGRNVARVAATRKAVHAARTRLENETTTADAAVESARVALRATGEALVSVLGPDRAVEVTGLGRRRLAALRAGR